MQIGRDPRGPDEYRTRGSPAGNTGRAVCRAIVANSNAKCVLSIKLSLTSRRKLPGLWNSVTTTIRFGASLPTTAGGWRSFTAMLRPRMADSATHAGSPSRLSTALNASIASEIRPVPYEQTPYSNGNKYS